MSGWGEYAAAWVFFLLTHAVPVRPPVKSWLVARLAHSGYTLTYSALSVAALGWLITASGRAPFVLLWSMPMAAHWIVLAGMLLACLLIALSLGRPNPFSFGGAQNHRFDSRRPELLGLTRHPILLALGLWALAHLAVNGDLAHSLMFGGFALFSGFGMLLIDRCRQREMGPQAWHALRRRIAGAPISLPDRAALRIVLGIGTAIGLVLAHRWVSGVEIWPRFLP